MRFYFFFLWNIKFMPFKVFPKYNHIMHNFPFLTIIKEPPPHVFVFVKKDPALYYHIIMPHYNNGWWRQWWLWWWWWCPLREHNKQKKFTLTNNTHSYKCYKLNKIFYYLVTKINFGSYHLKTLNMTHWKGFFENFVVFQYFGKRFKNLL